MARQQRWVSEEEFAKAWRSLQEATRFQAGDTVGIVGTPTTGEVIAANEFSVWVKTTEGNVKEFTDRKDLVNFREN